MVGRALKILNNYKKAEEELSIAILLDTQNPALYIERGDIRFRTGQQIKVIIISIYTNFLCVRSL